jgi:hypothetical protein
MAKERLLIALSDAEMNEGVQLEIRTHKHRVLLSQMNGGAEWKRASIALPRWFMSSRAIPAVDAWIDAVALPRLGFGLGSRQLRRCIERDGRRSERSRGATVQRPPRHIWGVILDRVCVLADRPITMCRATGSKYRRIFRPRDHKWSPLIRLQSCRWRCTNVDRPPCPGGGQRIFQPGD